MDHKIESCLIFAARYSLNRHTGAASLVVDAAKEMWDDLELYTREQLIRESREATTNIGSWESLRVFANNKKETNE